MCEAVTSTCSCGQQRSLGSLLDTVMDGLLVSPLPPPPPPPNLVYCYSPYANSVLCSYRLCSSALHNELPFAPLKQQITLKTAARLEQLNMSLHSPDAASVAFLNSMLTLAFMLMLIRTVSSQSCSQSY